MHTHSALAEAAPWLRGLAPPPLLGDLRSREQLPLSTGLGAETKKKQFKKEKSQVTAVAFLFAGHESEYKIHIAVL